MGDTDEDDSGILAAPALLGQSVSRGRGRGWGRGGVSGRKGQGNHAAPSGASEADSDSEVSDKKHKKRVASEVNIELGVGPNGSRKRKKAADIIEPSEPMTTSDVVTPVSFDEQVKALEGKKRQPKVNKRFLE
jgi:hypothetical protein